MTSWNNICENQLINVQTAIRRAADFLKSALNVFRSIGSIFVWFSGSIVSPFKSWLFPARNTVLKPSGARVGANEDSSFTSTWRVEKWGTAVAQIWTLSIRPSRHIQKVPRSIRVNLRESRSRFLTNFPVVFDSVNGVKPKGGEAGPCS
jgi:hypothetical protein